MRNKQKGSKKENGETILGVENPFIPYQRFWLDGDALELPSKPSEPRELLKGLEHSLNTILSKEEPWEKIVGASLAIQKLLDWLFAHAIHGEELAQGQIADIAEKTTQEFLYHARKHSPGILSRIKLWPEMPGWVSRAPHIQEEMGVLCRELNQGVHYPFPLSAKEVVKGNVHQIQKAHHLLVDQLYGHMGAYRRVTQQMPWVLEHELRDTYYVDKRVFRLANLPPLSTASVKDWISASREVLEDATNGNPANHPAFIKGGKFAALGNRDNRGDLVLWKRLAEAWKLRAKEMERLPEDSSHRK